MILNDPIVLASQSPRRKQMLEGLGIAFTVVPSRVEEKRLNGETPLEFASRSALEKGMEVCDHLSDQGESPWIISADTIVVLDGDVFMKPTNEEDARSMLTRLSGRTHSVITAWALGKSGQSWHQDHAETKVTFHELTKEQISRYVSTGEGRDKAGAYAIQGIGSFLVDRIHGNYYNVVGMPISHVTQALIRFGALVEFP